MQKFWTLERPAGSVQEMAGDKNKNYEEEEKLQMN